MNSHPSDSLSCPRSPPAHRSRPRCCAPQRLTLLWSGGAQATPAKDFSSDVTMTFVEKLRVISEEEVDSRGRRREDGHRQAHRHETPPTSTSSPIRSCRGATAAGTRTRARAWCWSSPVPRRVYEGDDPSCAPTIVPAGGSFIDAGGTHVHMVRNESATQTLVTLAFQVIPAGAARASTRRARATARSEQRTRAGPAVALRRHRRSRSGRAAAARAVAFRQEGVKSGMWHCPRASTHS